VEVDRIKLSVKWQSLNDIDSFNYIINPLRQSGFGAARPRTFHVRLIDSRHVEVFYINGEGKSSKAQSENLLTGTDFPLLRLDLNSGLQETIDFSILATGSGLYQLKFVAQGTAQGQPYELQTTPLYILRK
jgi:hypothetical protein